MTPATEILKQILTDQLRRTIDGQEAVRQILTTVRKQVLAEIAGAPADSFTGYRQTQILGEIDRLLTESGATIRTEVAGGIGASWDEGVAMLPAMARGAGVSVTTFGISSHLMEQIRDFAWGRVNAVTTDAQARIRAEITMGILGQKTPQEIAGAIAGTLERPGVFKSIAERAEVIVKTEMGRAFSMAHQASLEAAADTLPDLEKMWLHAGHPKTPRIYHLHMHGNTTPVDTPFLVGSIAMMYPRDPKAPISEIINCGCVHVAWMPEFGTKEEYRTSWKAAQKAANRRQ